MIEENEQLKEDNKIKTEQINALEMVYKYDLDEATKTISENTSLIENMRSEIQKLEAKEKENCFPDGKLDKERIMVTMICI